MVGCRVKIKDLITAPLGHIGIFLLEYERIADYCGIEVTSKDLEEFTKGHADLVPTGYIFPVGILYQATLLNKIFWWCRANDRYEFSYEIDYYEPMLCHLRYLNDDVCSLEGFVLALAPTTLIH